ncbi:putative polynucleotide 5'-hydroxyl-kinase GRC3/NOL9 [Monocercomonoides exilis]|uniref:putative polynucleotide 5'-hydroxyl-kinase GRC3/NOL9 n=1 Tax=Monocercomonoides exilis TaxID=2049356 RepID=UPI00355973F7|nr:putative polynucleotide 5'-hydroxyl-kinase GRC3/NOL9 [Monocercomonoides exilis]|eukprot:MONOS_11495.1-p1 / transcript=MONOS_11495.1 / gene=MONOS_11495 / organism=Monocercomonoides_exilis_PA203 / gene_product=unspecified product / transcript_product=unspecified product / location=Mono_scaffold00580:14774-18352(+) / protein_length=1192 / sequence_SO=supercontig / SO=protein_coding / is_pseudo=false
MAHCAKSIIEETELEIHMKESELEDASGKTVESGKIVNEIFDGKELNQTSAEIMMSDALKDDFSSNSSVTQSNNDNDSDSKKEHELQELSEQVTGKSTDGADSDISKKENKGSQDELTKESVRDVEADEGVDNINEDLIVIDESEGNDEINDYVIIDDDSDEIEVINSETGVYDPFSESFEMSSSSFADGGEEFGDDVQILEHLSDGKRRQSKSRMQSNLLSPSRSPLPSSSPSPSPSPSPSRSDIDGIRLALLRQKRQRIPQKLEKSLHPTGLQNFFIVDSPPPDIVSLQDISPARSDAGVQMPEEWILPIETIVHHLIYTSATSTVPDVSQAPFFSEEQSLAALPPFTPKLTTTNSVLLMGTKNAGKSTLAHFIANSLLNVLPFVFVLDCDVGQPLLTAPGFVSLVAVFEPLLNPPWMNVNPLQQNDCDRIGNSLKSLFEKAASEKNGEDSAKWKALTSAVSGDYGCFVVDSVFIGDVSMVSNPLLFVNAIKRLLTTYRLLCRNDVMRSVLKSSSPAPSPTPSPVSPSASPVDRFEASDANPSSASDTSSTEQSASSSSSIQRGGMKDCYPLIINTPGWVQGMGMHCLMSIIANACPMFVVQLTWTQVKKVRPDDRRTPVKGNDNLSDSEWVIQQVDLIRKFAAEEKLPLVGWEWPDLAGSSNIKLHSSDEKKSAQDLIQIQQMPLTSPQKQNSVLLQHYYSSMVPLLHRRTDNLYPSPSALLNSCSIVLPPRPDTQPPRNLTPSEGRALRWMNLFGGWNHLWFKNTTQMADEERTETSKNAMNGIGKKGNTVLAGDANESSLSNAKINPQISKNESETSDSSQSSVASNDSHMSFPLCLPSALSFEPPLHIPCDRTNLIWMNQTDLPEGEEKRSDFLKRSLPLSLVVLSRQRQKTDDIAAECNSSACVALKTLFRAWREECKETVIPGSFALYDSKSELRFILSTSSNLTSSSSSSSSPSSSFFNTSTPLSAKELHVLESVPITCAIVRGADTKSNSLTVTLPLLDTFRMCLDTRLNHTDSSSLSLPSIFNNPFLLWMKEQAISLRYELSSSTFHLARPSLLRAYIDSAASSAKQDDSGASTTSFTQTPSPSAVLFTDSLIKSAITVPDPLFIPTVNPPLSQLLSQQFSPEAQTMFEAINTSALLSMKYVLPDRVGASWTVGEKAMSRTSKHGQRRRNISADKLKHIEQ